MENPFRDGDRGFDYPLMLPNATIYTELGEDPEVSDTVVGLAKDQKVAELRLQLLDVDKAMDPVYKEIKGWREAITAAATQATDAATRFASFASIPGAERRRGLPSQRFYPPRLSTRFRAQCSLRWR